MNVITINNVIKNYNSNGLIVNAIRGVDLEIVSGGFAALAGPSGSGKTTLLNLIGGLDKPSEGCIIVNENQLDSMSAKELSLLRLNEIGFIFQAYNLIPVLTAVENVEYILLLQGVDKEEREERSIKMLKEVGLGKELNRKPSEMSGGQQQRVAVARAIVSEPAIVLADEPTANLDQKTGADLLDMMHSLNKNKGITFLFSTHDSMVMDRADRIIQLVDGKVIKDIRKKGKRKKAVTKKKEVKRTAKKVSKKK